MVNNIMEKLSRLAYEPNARLNAISALESMLAISNDERKALLEGKLFEQLRYVAKYSRFYSNSFQKHGINITEINSVKEFSTLPFTTKNDLRDQYPLGLLATGIEDVSRYAESTGTTGRPTSAYFSRDEWFENNILVAHRLVDIIYPEDVALVAAPYELSIPAQDLERIFEIIGTTIVACGVLNHVCSWERLINIIRDVKPTVLVCSGTRALLMAEMAKRMGYNPSRDFTVKKIINIGETANRAKAKKIREIWNADIYNAYGMTEACALGITCKHGNMHVFDEKYYFEIVDPKTGEPLPAGQKGELVITSLTNKSMPLIRYKTEDLVSIKESDCKCGNVSPVLEHYGRVGENIEIDTFSISYLKLEELIMNCEGHDCLYKVEYSEDEISITLDLKDGFTIDDVKKAILDQLPQEIHSKLIVRSFSKDEREDYFAFLKNSLKPFAKMFSSK